jgi:hypothetical protein
MKPLSKLSTSSKGNTLCIGFPTFFIINAILGLTLSFVLNTIWAEFSYPSLSEKVIFPNLSLVYPSFLRVIEMQSFIGLPVAFFIPLLNCSVDGSIISFFNKDIQIP